MATTTKFAVHSFHINIDVGDSAIHLLVDDTTRPKPTVYRAVYIDGGKSGQTQYSSTTSVIREIQTVYTPDPGGHFDLFGDAADNNWLRFDAIIVTHFDDDHYGGVQYLINEGFLVTAEAEAEKLRLEVQNAMATIPWPPAKKDQAKWIEDNDAVRKALAVAQYVQNRYMKYKTIEAGFADPPADTDELLTTLYLPYMSTDKGGNPKTKFFSSESYQPNRCWATPSNVLEWGCDVAIAEINNYPKGLKKGSLKTGGTRTFTFDNVCKLVANPEAYIGADVFAGLGLTAGRWTTIANPGLLVKEWNLQPADGPRMYIVAGHQTVLGNKQALVTAASSAGTKKDPFVPAPVVSFAEVPRHNQANSAESHSQSPAMTNNTLPIRPKEPLGNGSTNIPIHEATEAAHPPKARHGPQVVSFVVDEAGAKDGILGSRGWAPNKRNANSFARNASSICCMVLSKTTNTDENKAFKALHYFGGDALWDTEAGIALWASADGTPIEIEAMKMSHHGAMASLPISMLEVFKPKRIIGSVGPGGGIDVKYGHPRSELMLYLAPWLRKWMDYDLTLPEAQRTRVQEAIFTTNYPGYFNVHGRTKLTIVVPVGSWTLKAEDLEGSAAGVWRAFLWDLCDKAKIMNDGENVLSTWGKNRYDPKDENYDIDVNQAILATRISELYDTWEGSKPSATRMSGTGIDDVDRASCIELRLSPNPGKVLATTWRGDGTTGRIPFPMPPAPMDTSPRVSRSHSLPLITLGVLELPALERSQSTLLVKRPRDAIFGVPGEDASPKLKAPRIDTIGQVVNSTTNRNGPGGVPDADVESGSIGIASNDMQVESNTIQGPLGLGPTLDLHATTLATKIDPFIHTDLAVLPTAVSTAATVNAPDQLIRLYGTLFQNQASQFGARDVLLSGANNVKLDGFVNSLSMAYLTCDPPTSASEYILHADDEWMHRMIATQFGFTSFSIIGTIVPPGQGQISQTMQIQSLKAALAVNGHTLTFSSAASTSVCGLPATTSTYADALLDSYTIITLGVQSVSPDGSISLADLVPTTSRVSTWTTLFSLTGVKLKIDPSPGSRTAVSFQPGSNSIVWRRLQLVPEDPTWTLETMLPFLAALKLSFSNTQFILRSQARVLRNALAATVTELHELIFRTTITITNPSFQATMWWVFGDATTSLIVCFTADQDLGSLVNWIVDLLNTNQGASFTKDDIHPDTLFQDMPNTKQPGQTGPKAFIQQIQLVLNTPPGELPSIANFTLVLEVDLFGAAFNVQVSGPPVRLSASLWSQLPDTSIVPRPGSGVAGPYVPFLEDYQTLHPFGDVSGEINLVQLVGSTNGSSPPLGIEVDITELYLSLERSSGSTKASFGGSILCDKPSDDDGFPHLDIAIFSIYGDFETAGPSTQSFYDIKLETQIFLFDLRSPPPAQTISPAALDVAVEVSQGVWTITAAAVDLQFGALYQLFDKDANSSIVDVLSHISIPILQATYVYSPTGPSSLNVMGALVIGSLELELDYSYTSADPSTNKPKTWSIEAFLGAVGDNTHTLGSVITDLDPDLGGFLDEVPFVRDCSLPVTPPVDEFNSNGFIDAPIQLLCSTDGTYTVMCFRIEIVTPAGSLSCTCVRFQPTSLGSATARPQPKLIVRVALDKLPSIPSIPVVGSLPQPVDDIDYLFVRDPNVADGAPSGVSDTELAAVNAILTQGHFAEIPSRNVQSDFKSSGPPPSGDTSGSTSTAANYVLLAGHHFMVRVDGNVIVDHVFGKGSGPAPTPPPTQALFSTSSAGNDAPQRSGGIADQETPTTSGAMKKTFGPLSVNNFGIQLKSGFLYFVLDLTIAMGPVQLTILGLGVGASLKAFNLNQLANLTVDDFSIILSGMSLFCSAPPVTIGGVFIHQDDALAELYEGGLTVAIPPYTLLAVGAYRKMKPDGFKSVFVFARFDGPLLTLEFAEISGVEAGFGYNYDLTMPGADNILSYPLLHSQVGTNNPYDILTQFGQWNIPQEGHFWFAIGCKVDAFELLSVDAAIILAFSTDGDFKIGLAGLATASMPPMVTKREEAFLYVELGIIGAVDIGQGSMWVEAQLTPNSFILYPDCHLTGGFALCYWFPPSPHEGDWVFTVGGYHPAFKPPSYYPQVDEVGISWNLSDALTVRGGAFFAITPNAAMAGGRLKANFSAFIVEAYFEAWAMMLLKFKPFFFIADIGVTVGCGVHISLGLIDLSFDVDISATLHLSGPRFGGTVYVDLKIHTFSIDFGDQDNTPDALDWTAFLNTVRQSGPKAAAGNETTDLVIAIVDGTATDSIKSTQSSAATTDASVKPSVWSVRAGSFVFRVESKVPVDTVAVDDGAGGRKVTASSNPSPAYPRLMEYNVSDQLSGSLSITIKPASAAADADSNPWELTPMVKSLPLALWAKYDEQQDPIRSQNNNIASQLDPSNNATAAEHCVGYIISAPKPALPPPENILPEFNAADAMEEAIFPDGGTPPRKDHRPLINPPITDDLRPRIPKANGSNSAEFYPQPRPSGVTAPADLWANVKSTWNAANATDAQTITDTWTDLMGWGNPQNQVAPLAPPKTTSTDPQPPPVYPIPLFTALQAGVPTQVLDQFDTYFLGLPQVAEGVA